MKNSRYGIISLVLIAVLMLFGCSQPDMAAMKGLEASEPVVARINLPNEETMTRTILPGKLGNADHYTITLDNETADPIIFTDQKPESGHIDIIGVKPGSYTVAVDGFNAKGQKIYTGKSEQNLDIKVDTIGVVTVLLSPTVGPDLTGSIQVTFDWTTLLSDEASEASLSEAQNPEGPLSAAIAAGELSFELYTAEIGLPLQKTGETIKWTAEEGTSFKTCLFTGVPTSQNLAVAFSIKDKTGNTIVDKKYAITAQIYADQVSYYNGDPEFRLHLLSSMNKWYSNISNLAIEFPTENIDSSLILTWEDFRKPDGSSIFKEILFDVYRMQDSVKVGDTYKVVPSIGSENTLTVTGLEKGVPYYITTKTLSQGGKSSDIYKWTRDDGSGFVTKVEVTGITFSDDKARTMTTGESFPMTATVNPADASYTELSWSAEKEGTLFITDPTGLDDSVTVTANKPGVTAITVKNNDPKTPFTATTANRITITLSQPVNVTAEFSSEAKQLTQGVVLSWSNVEFAEQYEIYRSVDSSEYALIATVEDTSYIDTDVISGSSYTYKLKAKAPSIDKEYSTAYPDFKADSIDSAVTEAITVPVPQITIKPIDIRDKQFDIIDNGQNNLVIQNNIKVVTLKAGETLTITLQNPIEGMNTYSWFVNGMANGAVKTGSYAEANSITISSSLPNLDLGEDGLQELTLVVSNGKESYSMLIQFTVITRPVQRVDWAHTLRDDLRYSTANPAGTLALKAVTYPGNATMNDIKYKVTNVVVPEGDLDTNVASIDENTGVITILKEGEVTFRASSLENPDIYQDVTLIFYRPTIDTPANIVKEVNKVLGGHISKANDSFGHSSWHITTSNGDWWHPSSRSWSEAEGAVTIKSNSSESQNTSNGGIWYNNYKAKLAFGDVTMNAQHIAVLAESYDGLAGNLGRDFLRYVGYEDQNSPAPAGDNIIKVTLPNYQGTASIKYNNIDVFADTITGKYVVSFDQDIMISADHTLKKGVEYPLNASDVGTPYKSTK